MQLEWTYRLGVRGLCEDMTPSPSKEFSVEVFVLSIFTVYNALSDIVIMPPKRRGTRKRVPIGKAVVRVRGENFSSAY